MTHTESGRTKPSDRSVLLPPARPGRFCAAGCYTSNSLQRRKRADLRHRPRRSVESFQQLLTPYECVVASIVRQANRAARCLGALLRDGCAGRRTARQWCAQITVSRMTAWPGASIRVAHSRGPFSAAVIVSSSVAIVTAPSDMQFGVIGMPSPPRRRSPTGRGCRARRRGIRR